MWGDVGTGNATGLDKAAIEWARGREDVGCSLGGRGGGGEESLGGSMGASGACFTFGEVSPTEDSLLRLGGRGGGRDRGRVGAGYGGGGGPTPIHHTTKSFIISFISIDLIQT